MLSWDMGGIPIASEFYRLDEAIAKALLKGSVTRLLQHDDVVLICFTQDSFRHRHSTEHVTVPNRVGAERSHETFSSQLRVGKCDLACNFGHILQVGVMLNKVAIIIAPGSGQRANCEA